MNAVFARPGSERSSRWVGGRTRVAGAALGGVGVLLAASTAVWPTKVVAVRVPEVGDFTKGYEQLVDEQLVEKRRGLGLFINPGARALLLKAERDRFLAEQWPEIAATIERLGLTPKELLAATTKPATTKPGTTKPGTTKPGTTKKGEG